MSAETEKHLRRDSRPEDGDPQTEELKTACAEEMTRCLEEQKKRYPRMNEEDVIKFAFQGMMGVGHLIPSEKDALEGLKKEMEGLEPDPQETPAEKISPYWYRINLRAAKARGEKAEELAARMCRSARMKPLPFTRTDVYLFCVRTDRSEKMRTAALRILDENWLPRHSEGYREAYAPAYRVMYRDECGDFPAEDR